LVHVVSPPNSGTVSARRIEAGVLEKREYSDAPPRSDYHLTRAGRELTPVLQALLEWGDEWAVAVPPITIQHHDQPLRSRTVCATCGQPVRQRDVRRVSNISGWDITGSAPARELLADSRRR
jgi:HxlR-like helix-turn-helix